MGIWRMNTRTMSTRTLTSCCASGLSKPGVIAARLILRRRRTRVDPNADRNGPAANGDRRPARRRAPRRRRYLPRRLRELARVQGKAFALNEDQCMEIDREFAQFYHRRICYLALRQFARAIADAEYTLQLMDFVAERSPTAMDAFARAVPPLRPLPPHSGGGDVGFRAARPRDRDRDDRPWPERSREVFAKFGAEEQFDGDELVGQLAVMKESLREEYRVGKTLAEQLADAVASEEYEAPPGSATKSPGSSGGRRKRLCRLAQRFGLVELVVERLDVMPRPSAALGLLP